MSAQSSLPDPVDISHYFSRTTQNRLPSSIKSFYKYFTIPGIGQLAGGLPNSSYFPYDTLEAKVALPDRWNKNANVPVDPPASGSSERPFTREVVPKESSTQDPLLKIDLTTALQYGRAQGYPPLYYFLRQFTRNNLHPNVPYNGGPEIILTCGSTDGFAKTIETFNNPWAKGDPIEEKEGLLCEEYAYMNAIAAARPRGMNIVPVGVDDQGMRASGPGGLQHVLEHWDFSRGKRPHMMYTVTIGQNPTGATLGVQRRKDIYAICVEYDVLIVEDDPYWYLQYPSAISSMEPPSTTSPSAKSSGFPFLDSLVPSYLSVDTQGRVIRLDTFSKTIAPGCRLGWITAQPAVVDRILRIAECSTQQPSGFVQSMVAELIIGPQKGSEDDGRGGGKDGRGWAVDGWVRWLEGLRAQYEKRMNVMCDILEDGRELVKMGRRGSLADLTLDDEERAKNEEEDEWAVLEKIRMYDFVRPLGGMFLWVRFDFSTHPLAKKVPLPRLAHAQWVFWTLKPYLVLVSPGQIFAPTQEVKDRDAWECFRLCFAAVEADQLESISKNFVKGVKAFWRIKSVEKINEILKDDDESGESAMSRELASEMGVVTGFC